MDYGHPDTLNVRIQDIITPPEYCEGYTAKPRAFNPVVFEAETVG